MWKENQMEDSAKLAKKEIIFSHRIDGRGMGHNLSHKVGLNEDAWQSEAHILFIYAHII